MSAIGNKFSLKAKTIFGFSLIILLIAVLIIVAKITIVDLDKGYSELTENKFKKIQILQKQKILMLTLRRHEKDFLLRGDLKYLERHAKTSKELAPLNEELISLLPKDLHEKANFLAKNTQAYTKGFSEIVQAINEEGDSKTGIRGELRSIAHSIEKFILNSNLSDYYNIQLLTFRRREKDFLLRRDNKYLDKLNKDIAKVYSRMEEKGLDDERKVPLKTLIDKYQKQFVILTKNTEQINQIKADFRKNIHAVEKTGDELLDYSYKTLNVQKDELHAESENAIIIFYIVSALILFIVIGINFFAYKLTQTITSYVEKLKELSNDFLNTSSLVDTSSKTLNDLASSQASAIQETASSVNQITAMVSKNTDSAVQSKQRSEENAQAARTGKETVVNVISAMNRLSGSSKNMTQRFNQTSKELEDVVTIINQIGEKAKVINDIVFQTKLLSFNASVEAERAGEHGKGFAVVAQEVGNLATMSGESAEEITKILDESVKMVQKLVSSNQVEIEKLVQENTSNVDAGISTAKECEVALNTIMNNVNDINQAIGEIAQASQEQDTGVKEISSAVNEFNASNQKTVSVANESRTQAKTIKSNAEVVYDLAQKMQVLLLGDRA